MLSNVRLQCSGAVNRLSRHSAIEKHRGKILLYVGIAGDPPGGEYKDMFCGFRIITCDIGKEWLPQVLTDITCSGFGESSIAIVLCIQVIEHVRNLWQLPTELYRIICPDGCIIVDSPWQLGYHGEARFGDYWRVSKDGFNVLFAEPRFTIVELIEQTQNTTCLIVVNKG